MLKKDFQGKLKNTKKMKITKEEANGLNQALLVIDAQQALIDGDEVEKGVIEKESLVKI